MEDATKQHLSPEEIELWAQGLLDAARAMHLAECSLCFAEAQRERRIIVQLAQLPRHAPSAGFATRVMAKVKLPTTI